MAHTDYSRRMSTYRTNTSTVLLAYDSFNAILDKKNQVFLRISFNFLLSQKTIFQLYE